jgi:RNA polymerase sigma-70 factor (ECF subfamily)
MGYMKKPVQKFQDIISSYQDMIYRLCCSYVEDSEMRNDLYQNILIRLWRGMDSFESRASIKTWVYRISVNTGLDFLRKEFKSRFRSNHIDIDKVTLSDTSMNQEEEYILTEKTQLMFRCINRFSFIDKTIISLYLEDLSYREISEIVGITEKNVSVKLSRIKKKLSQCLKDIE